MDHPKQPAWRGCNTCLDYLDARRSVLAPHIARVMHQREEMPSVTVARLMNGAHRRHLAGLPLLGVTR